ncbi:hypothetical protein [Chitinimonas sp. BJB300]|uniref:hypothetical protein n=1 Tax=Chitinimonas sp. BJB300 TaxID=1559339 RepID=UPI000C12053B|nr:hypothetical protein [Chitinimonas sp. BJB300]PHV13172.1 hypothetical protein CSQ89_01890 [Chitinimonas sp. BJB300]TSJ87154.1 hypothetical protein FG002_015390 [Chitinimonas sp. BJB300]
MPTPLIPQEIYLLERYSSLAYYEPMRDAWEAMLKHVEDCMDRFMRQLPPDYRNRAQHHQPDIGWGTVCLPNFRSTMQSLNEGYIMLTHGDLHGLGGYGGVPNDVKGQRDYDPTWMDEVEPGAAAKYEELLYRASHFASNIQATTGGYWKPGSLVIRYRESVRGPLNPPETWPIYRLNNIVQVKTDDIVKQSGIYLPDVDDSCAALLIEGDEATTATVGYNPDTMQNISEEPTTWTLVERIADSGGGETSPSEQLDRLRCESDKPCPKSGYWWTPAAGPSSRKQFKQGETMPEIKSGYGATIWQWDANQAD